MLPTANATDHALAALAHPVRRAIVDRLLEGELTVGEIAQPYDLKIPTVSRHLKVLEGAQLIQRTVEGRQHRCRLNPDGIGELHNWLQRYSAFWNAQLDSLETFINDQR